MTEYKSLLLSPGLVTTYVFLLVLKGAKLFFNVMLPFIFQITASILAFKTFISQFY